MFYDRLQKLCLREGLSVTALCNELGIGKGTASGWKKGATPSPRYLKLISDYFSEPTSLLLYNENDHVVDVEIEDDKNDVRTGRSLSQQEDELLRIFEVLDVKGQTRLLSLAYELEAELEPYRIAARGGQGVIDVRDKKEKGAIDQLFSEVESSKK